MTENEAFDPVLDGYVSPLAGRYASRAMQRVWSARNKFGLWRRIWLALAEAQHEMGLPVSAEQVAELRANLDVTRADLERAGELEAELRHDVMAHVHAWGERCPLAKPIIHLGMTSQDVNDNCELLQLEDAACEVHQGLTDLQLALMRRAREFRDVPALAFTHYQPAQPTTIGRRFAQYAYDVSRLGDMFIGPEWRFKLRGLRGATGTQASYLTLCDNDAERVGELERRFVDLLCDDDWPERPHPPGDYDNETFTLTGQTYPRLVDAEVLCLLANICAVVHKMAVDIRLLSNRKEMDEPFGSKQIGSSAMPYKRNPMKCERVCGLARFVMNLVGNAYETAATQWLERTLDDSANRRLVLPEAFLATDACLGLMTEVIEGLVVHEAQVRKNLMAELPFLATEHVLMEAVKRGGDRQALHEKIRVHAQAAGARVKGEGLENDLIERLRGDEAFASVHGLLTEGELLDPMRYVGLAAEQTERYLAENESWIADDGAAPGEPEDRDRPGV